MKRSGSEVVKSDGETTNTVDHKSVDEGKHDSTGQNRDKLNIDGIENTKVKKTKKGKKKKVKKKKKLTKEERTALKFNKEYDQFINSGTHFDYFIEKTHSWTRQNRSLITDTYAGYDKADTGRVTHMEFKFGLLDLNSPHNKLETVILCRLLDMDDTGEIEYEEFAMNGVNYSSAKPQILEDGEIMLTRYKVKTETKCPCCAFKPWEPLSDPFPMHVNLELRLIPFDNMVKHLGHVKLDSDTQTTIEMLGNYLKDEARVSCRTIAIFTTPQSDEPLPNTFTLEDIGVEGSLEKVDAEEITLYYNYLNELEDCPLLDGSSCPND